MNLALQPWRLLFAILSGWVNHRQQRIIEFQNSQTILTSWGQFTQPRISTVLSVTTFCSFLREFPRG